MLLNHRYEFDPVADLIGRGGLAEVYKAFDRQRKCFVALKVFHPTTESVKYSIQQEFQKSIHFAHGNIVRAYDFFTVERKFEDGGTHETQYGVMELVEGGDLADYLKTKPKNEDLLNVVTGILEGLKYLHTADPTTDKGIIIHRDIKPGNILMYKNSAGQHIPKIADFNVAKEVSNNLESSVSMVGTYEYMAPEQLNLSKYGIDNHIHANTDLWALGVILCDYFMQKSLFGKRSEGSTQGQIIGNILDKPIPDKEIKLLPAPFNGIILRCLVRKASDRVQSAANLLQYIKASEDKTTIDPPKPPKVPPEWKNMIKLMAVAATLIIIFLVYQRLSPPKDPFAGDMIFVEGGTFTMGCSSLFDINCQAEEFPPHSKTVNSFYISKYEVTQAQWRAVMGSDSPELYNRGCDQCPVERVSWNEIPEFLSKLNHKTDKKYRLPTEAEWEFAAGGGNKSNGFKYSGSNDIDKVAWYKDNNKPNSYGTENTTHPVGTKAPNELGLYDMSGNVWEWCQDWFKGYPGSSGVNDYTGSRSVLRGGGWYTSSQGCRVVHRYNTPEDRSNDLGFRLLLVP